MAVENGKFYVTGAGGFVGSWVVKLLLSKNCIVHGTVREPRGVIRNDKGEWVNGFSLKLGFGQVLEAELWDLLKGMDLAWNSGCRLLEMEMDSLVAVQLVLSPIENLHLLFSLVANCQELLKRDWCVALVHVYRERNSVADMMASLSHQFDHGCRLFNSHPPEVVKLFEDDLLGLTKPRLVLS